MKKLLKLALFALFVLLLQQGLKMTEDYFFAEETQVIQANDMDPSIIFYTESDHALDAEKEVRKTLNER